MISGSDLLKHLGPENFCTDIQAARAREVQGNFEGVGPEVALKMKTQTI